MTNTINLKGALINVAQLDTAAEEKVARQAEMTNTVKIERTRINMSQQDLAEKVKVSRQTIHSIESGKFMPSYVLAIKIARVLNLPVESVFVVPEED